MDNSVFAGSYSSDGVPRDARVAVLRPSVARPASAGRLLLATLGVAAVAVAGPQLSMISGGLRLTGTVAMIGLCLALTYLYFRNTKLFATDEHFGVTNLFGEMTLVPRKNLARVEALDGYCFQTAEGATLLLVGSSPWTIEQVRRLTAFLAVPFEVGVRGRMAG
ncbi:MAG: hypothetical protein ACT4OM_02260 [Actinomycetota bacterium]